MKKFVKQILSEVNTTKNDEPFRLIFWPQSQIEKPQE